MLCFCDDNYDGIFLIRSTISGRVSTLLFISRVDPVRNNDGTAAISSTHSSDDRWAIPIAYYTSYVTSLL
jgi:hypothetical protein